MKVRMLEKVKHHGQVFEADDQRTVDDETGAYFCANGWAEDMSGTVPTGERSTTEVRLTPDSVVKAMAAGEVS